MADTDTPHGSAFVPAPFSARSDQRGPVDLSAILTAARKHWSELVRDIEAVCDAYYNAIDAESPLSDADYDTLCRELEGLEAVHPLLARAGSPTHSVGGHAVIDFASTPYREHMHSLQDVFFLDEVQEQAERIVVETGVGDDELAMTVEVKIDDLAVTLTHEDGVLTRTVTRGDDTTGEDVIGSICTVASVPLALAGDAHPSLLEVCGEIYSPTQDSRAFSGECRIRNVQRQTDGALLLQVFANPHNAVAGSLRQKSPVVTASRPLVTIAHGVDTTIPASGGSLSTRQHEWYEPLAGWRLPMFPYDAVVRGRIERGVYIERYVVHRHDPIHGTDGIVFKLDGHSLQRHLGHISRVPRWATAYKYPPKEVCTCLLDIAVQVGRTGRVTPLGMTEPVPVIDSTVAHAVLHSTTEVARKGMRIGDMVIVRETGDVTPEILGPIADLRDDGERGFVMSTHCPSCGTKLASTKNGDVGLRCSNTRSYPTQLTERIAHTGSRGALNAEGPGDETAGALAHFDAGHLEALMALTVGRSLETKGERLSLPSGEFESPHASQRMETVRELLRQAGVTKQTPMLTSGATLLGLTEDDLREVFV